MKIDQIYSKYFMKQNCGPFWKSIFLQNSLINFWDVEVGLLNCIFVIKTSCDNISLHCCYKLK